MLNCPSAVLDSSVKEAKVNSAPNNGERILEGMPRSPIAKATKHIFSASLPTKSRTVRLSRGRSAGGNNLTNISSDLPFRI